MKFRVIKYRLVFCCLFALSVYSCGGVSGDSEEEMETSDVKKEQPEAAMSELEATEETSIQSKSNQSLEPKKWKNKAKQQLESIQDLTMILNDSTLDFDFKQEIEKELNALYDISDTSMYDLHIRELNFKNFKELKIESENTMSLHFKNKKDNLKAEFIVVKENKTFGESIETVERLKLLSIRKEQ